MNSSMLKKELKTFIQKKNSDETNEAKEMLEKNSTLQEEVRKLKRE